MGADVNVLQFLSQIVITVPDKAEDDISSAHDKHGPARGPAPHAVSMTTSRTGYVA
jgi:hypothetical protein